VIVKRWQSLECDYHHLFNKRLCRRVTCKFALFASGRAVYKLYMHNNIYTNGTKLVVKPDN